ncbi:MAG: ASPIC/UnbV domain-containing protein [Candidatus Handelsmanbacteria bacterium]|nr:ASPIC/UnbV domain-containing protein [Candidatus Handelsmanbacteria bacterium]
MDAATRTQGVMLGDYDGDLEVCVVNEGSTNFLYRNGGHQGYWLQVAVEGVESNRDGIGIRLHAFAGGRRYTDEVNGTAGMSHSNRPVHLGLGAATRLDSLVVRWTNGQVDTYQGVEADGALRLVEGQRLTAAAVEEVVYNTLGQPVRRLADQFMEAGGHRLVWDRSAGQGRALSSGIYFCRLRAGGWEQVWPMILLR